MGASAASRPPAERPERDSLTPGSGGTARPSAPRFLSHEPCSKRLAWGKCWTTRGPPAHSATVLASRRLLLVTCGHGTRGNHVTKAFATPPSSSSCPWCLRWQRASQVPGAARERHPLRGADRLSASPPAGRPLPRGALLLPQRHRAGGHRGRVRVSLQGPRAAPPRAAPPGAHLAAGVSGPGRPPPAPAAPSPASRRTAPGCTAARGRRPTSCRGCRRC